VDHAWAVAQLEEFKGYIDVLYRYRGLGDDPWTEDTAKELNQRYGGFQDVVDRLVTMEPIIKETMEAVRPELGDYIEARGDSNTPYSVDEPNYWWDIIRPKVLRAIGIHTLGAEARERLRPDSPDLVADQFHAWVWDAAVPLWLAGSKQEAVQAAARSVNARLQQKLASGFRLNSCGVASRT
jgi:hypothetical protein